MRRKKKNIPKIVKTIPLSVAIAALSAGTAFADTAEYDTVYVDMGNGKHMKIVLDDITGSEKELIQKAFLNGSKSILVEANGTVVEFGLNAGKAALGDILENDEYVVNKDDIKLY